MTRRIIPCRIGLESFHWNPRRVNRYRIPDWQPIPVCRSISRPIVVDPSMEGDESMSLRTTIRRFFVGILPLIAIAATPQTNTSTGSPSMETVEHLKDFQVIEFRRYTIKPGEREHFAQYFESF